FNELKTTVPLASSPLAFTFGPPGGPPTETTLTPRRNPDERYPTIGVTPSMALRLTDDPPQVRPAPVWRHSAAARARPAFQFGDEIVATTDPDDPATVTELPANQHNPQSTARDYFAFRQRLHRLAGRDLAVRVMRQGQPVD